MENKYNLGCAGYPDMNPFPHLKDFHCFRRLFKEILASFNRGKLLTLTQQFHILNSKSISEEMIQ